MAIDRQITVAKFMQAGFADFILQQDILAATWDRMGVVLKVSKSGTNCLDEIRLNFPVGAENDPRYAHRVDVFWVCSLPSGTPLGNYRTDSFRMFAEQGRYEQTFGDVHVSMSEIGGDYRLAASSGS